MYARPLARAAVLGPFPDLVAAIGHTPLVELRAFSPKPGVRLFAKLEGHNPTGSVKDRVARQMVEAAEREGRLRPGVTLIEPTSGNTGISLAMIARRKGYRMIAVLPENVSEERKQLLRLYGAEIVGSDPTKGSNGAIELAQQLVAADPSLVMLYQYGNPANPQAHYETTGPEIVAALPEVDYFVAGLGTGGTLMGVGRYLKEHNPRVQVVAAEPDQGELVQGLRSLADGFIPPILDLELLDRKLIVDTARSVELTRELVVREGIFAGVSSGAALYCALRLAQRIERGNIVVLFADGGWKYLSTGIWDTSQAADAEAFRQQLLW
ncbi:MAG TPA: cysteine synthase family protein [Chloroflexota bacterium]|jgi:cysteine synthase|nr:cysteine synthase family protein [Chloroflexota bacterium]